MPSQSIFTPNSSSGPCLYCNVTFESKPEELLKCELCHRSAHFTCLKTGIPEARLLGDNFFVFSCSNCNSNQAELVTRAQMSIVQVLALVLYNLHQARYEDSNEGFFHYKDHVYPFLIDNWDKIYNYAPDRWYKIKAKAKPSIISGQLAHYPQHFEVNRASGKRGWYKLVNPLPPAKIFYLHQKLSLQSKYKKNEAKRIKLEESIKIPGNSLTVPFASSSRSTSSASSASSNESLLRIDQSDDVSENFDDASSRGSWFSERDIVKPDMQLPTTIFEDEDHFMITDDLSSNPDINIDVDVTTEFIAREVTQAFPSENQKLEKPVLLPSLFTKSEECEKCSMDGQPLQDNEKLCLLSSYEERKLLNRFDRLNAMGQITPTQYRFRRKLKLRQSKREHNLSLFDIDAEIKFFKEQGRLMTNRERTIFNITSEDKSKVLDLSSRILDRFQISKAEILLHKTKERTSFKLKLIGSENVIDYIYSPFTLRKLKPYIYRDTSVKPQKVRLLEEILKYTHRNDPDWLPPPVCSIDYCYVTPRHIPSMNQLARQFFWPGIDLSEVLRYPDYTCVVLYGKLIIGFGILVPDTRPNESYISFLLVHPEFRRAGIAKFILYHLIQTSPGKDIALHVSAKNPALIMYQQFGFKAEEFLADFYDKYFPMDSIECKHAMFMRLSR